MITVLKPGMLTQVQDEGRWGWQADGVPVGGAMDTWAHRVANLLVGNTGAGDDAATLEILMSGPRLRFEVAATVALTGADLSPTVDGQPVPMGRRLRLRAGAELAFGRRVAGARACLAVAGGLDLPPVLGSRSTFARGGFGGWQGRALRAGDVLPLRTPTAAAAAVADDPSAPFTLGPPCPLDLLTHLPAPEPEACTRVLAVAGEHWPTFSPAAQHAFLAQTWRIGGASDRMGYRLQGPPGTALPKPDLGEMLSEGVALGTVQVPPDGQPIVLMAERQSTGGYPRIAHVASVDLSLLAQLMPGQALRFELVGLDRAQALLEDRERHFQRLRQALA